MPFQAYNKVLIVDQPIKNLVVKEKKVGYEFKIQYPSYRGTFLSCIEELTFRMDGEKIEPSQISFLLNGKQFLISELEECFKEYWFVLDYATIRVMQSGGLSLGEHTLRVYIKHKIPYTGYFGQYMEMDADVTKTLTAE